MPRPGSLTNRIKQRVRQRAKFLCEYCHTSERWQYVPFTVDHVLPIAKGGETGLENLALACFHCNRRKSDLVTAVGRATVTQLALNRERIIPIRADDILVNRHPPHGDPILGAKT